MPTPDQIPDQFARALLAYLERYEPPGLFLMAVLSNDLIAACDVGGAVGIASMPSIIAWLRQHDDAAACWGTRDRVLGWVARFDDGLPF